MISFISGTINGTLLKEEPCCKFMFKHDIKNYFWQFTKTLTICFQWTTTHTDLVICNKFWVEQSNICAKYGIILDKYTRFVA